MTVDRRFYNRLVFAILFVLFIGGGIVSVILPRLDLAEMKLFALEGTKMTAMFPAKPVKKKIKLEISGGKIDTTEYTSGTAAMIFSVNYTDLPESVLSQNPDATLESHYKNALDRITSRTKARVKSKKTVYYGGLMAEEVVLETGANAGIRTRFILAGNRFIQLIATTTADNLENKKIGQFMESFSLE